MFIVVSVLLVLFCILGIFDGLYFHIYKYKLHLVPEARREHAIHTIRGFIFVPIALLLFVFNTGGPLLYLGIVLVVLDAYLELIDILEEKRSRAPLGGITPEESAIHVFASSFKFAAVTLVLTTKSVENFSWNSPSLLAEPLPDYLGIIGCLFALGSLGGGILSLFPEYKIKVCDRICAKSEQRSVL